MSLRKTRARRAELIHRIAQQRSVITELTQTLERPFNLIDKGYILMKKLRQRPKLVFFGTLLLAVALKKPVIRKSAVLLSMAEWFLFKKNSS